MYLFFLQLKLMQSELNVEEVVNDRSLKVNNTTFLFHSNNLSKGALLVIWNILVIVIFSPKVFNERCRIHYTSPRIKWLFFPLKVRSSYTLVLRTISWAELEHLPTSVSVPHLRSPCSPRCALWLYFPTVKGHYCYPSHMYYFSYVVQNRFYKQWNVFQSLTCVCCLL